MTEEERERAIQLAMDFTWLLVPEDAPDYDAQVRKMAEEWVNELCGN